MYLITFTFYFVQFGRQSFEEVSTEVNLNIFVPPWRLIKYTRINVRARIRSHTRKYYVFYEESTRIKGEFSVFYRGSFYFNFFCYPSRPLERITLRDRGEMGNLADFFAYSDTEDYETVLSEYLPTPRPSFFDFYEKIHVKVAVDSTTPVFRFSLPENEIGDGKKYPKRNEQSGQRAGNFSSFSS